MEIGAGDCVMARQLQPLCRSLIATDPYRPRLADGVAVDRLVCDAARLPFADRSFDLIFSSSVLEHIRERQIVHQETARCLRPGGLVIHIMPSRTWKLLQLLFYYPNLVVGGIDFVLDHLNPSKILSRAASAAPATAPAAAASTPTALDRWSDKGWRLSAAAIIKGIVPAPHGEYPGHLAEWRGFEAGTWASEFESAGFAVHRCLQLPLYSGYGFGFERLRRLGERRGLSSHNAFLLSPRGTTPSALKFFGA
jgi:SAM-dependent methyltransferase